MQNFFQIATDLNIESETPFSFSAKSTVGCGGNAKIAFYPNSVEQLIALIARLQKEGIDYCVVGNLSNVLPPDGEYDGAIVRLKRLNQVRFDEGKTFAYAGVLSGAFLREIHKNGRMGAEFLWGIPCTLGGALYMNAGADGKYISEIVESVLVLRDGEQLLLPKSACEYRYKKSIFMKNGDVILGGYFRLKSAEREEIFSEEAHYRERRKHLPQGKSMGCVFKNPEGDFAGRLIERSGLKGFRIGGAKISEEHANFIINDRGATAEDIRSLITLAKNAVSAQYGVNLEEEIRYI